MKKILTTCVVIAIIFAVSSVPAWAYGNYNWSGGFAVSAAVGASSWNGWGYTPTAVNNFQSPYASVSAHANTFPNKMTVVLEGWPNLAFADAHNDGRSAWAEAYVQNAIGAMDYASNARAETGGTPTFATAYGRPQARYELEFNLPRLAWNSGAALWGAVVPLNFQWFYWGWFDGDMSETNMAVEMNLWAIDSVTGITQDLLHDGFVDNGDGTYTQLGDTLNTNDLVFNPNVDGNGNPGWDFIGHNGNIPTDSPYNIPFMISATETGGDMDNVELLVKCEINGFIGQPIPEEPIPEPATMLLFGTGIAVFVGSRVRKKNGLSVIS